MSTGRLARQRSSSSSSRPQVRTTNPITPFRLDQEFEPCAATASIFLYAQGSSIICLHHDTLAIDRRFESHKERILFLSVDNVSERGAGRLVVSYDASQTAIVWDLFTGDEIARFASYEPIRVAAWMKNGNVAFGRSVAHREGEQALMKPRQFAGERHTVRTIYVRARLCANDLRPHNGSCACSGLPNIRYWVCIAPQTESDLIDTSSGISMDQYCLLPYGLPSLSCIPCPHLALRPQLLI